MIVGFPNRWFAFDFPFSAALIYTFFVASKVGQEDVYGKQDKGE
jgi:hypothetical protein